MADRTSLMPPNAMPVMRPVDLVDAAQLDAPTEIIRTVKDPMRAPAALLPWLALEHRVTVTWDPAATVDRQREIIAAQYAILAHAGTPKGLADALAQLGLGVGYDEWPEYDGRPYHIRLRVAIDGARPWTAAFDRRALATTFAYKNRRTALELFTLARTLPAGGPAVGGAQALSGRVAYRLVEPDLAPPPAVPALGAAAQIRDRVAYRIAEPAPAPARAAAAVGLALWIRDRFTFARAA